MFYFAWIIHGTKIFSRALQVFLNILWTSRSIFSPLFAIWPLNANASRNTTDICSVTKIIHVEMPVESMSHTGLLWRLDWCMCVCVCACGFHGVAASLLPCPIPRAVLSKVDHVFWKTTKQVLSGNFIFSLSLSPWLFCRVMQSGENGSWSDESWLIPRLRATGVRQRAPPFFFFFFFFTFTLWIYLHCLGEDSFPWSTIT